MNKAQIKAELRRSACEDNTPSFTIADFAWREQLKWRDKNEDGCELALFSANDQRIFFLLVAEVL